jgi:class 3 adenylate cyclase
VAKHSRNLIPGARLVELDTDIHLIWLSDVVDVITREIEAFITQPTATADVERALTTVLAVADPTPSLQRESVIHRIIERFDGCRRPTQAPGRTTATFDGPARAIHCGLALVAELGPDDQNVAGAVHSGECERDADGLQGIAVDLAEQLAASAPPGQVLVTQTVRDLTVGSKVRLEPRGPRSFDGIPGDWEILAVSSVDH